MRTMPLVEIAPAKARKGALPPGKKVWHLTLDQIMSDSDKIIAPVYANASEASSSTSVFGPEHVLYSKLRPYLNKVICPDEIGIATTELVPLCPNPKLLDRRFLCYYLRSPEFVSWASNCVAGAKMPRLKMKVFWQYEIPVPPLPQQRQVVSILDKASSIREKYNKSIGELNTLIPAVFYKMFGNPQINEKEFTISKLGHIAEINPRSTKVSDESSGCSFVSMADVDEIRGEIVGGQQRTYYEVKKGFTRFCNGDVLFAKITPCMQNGKAAIADNLVNGIGFGSTEFHVLRPTEHSTAEWLYSLVRLPLFRFNAENAFTGSAGQKRVPTSFLKTFLVPVPPIKLQHEFALKVQVIRGLQDKYRKAAAESEDLFNSLAQRAFKGDL